MRRCGIARRIGEAAAVVVFLAMAGRADAQGGSGNQWRGSGAGGPTGGFTSSAPSGQWKSLPGGGRTWEWNNTTPTGYGRATWNGGTTPARGAVAGTTGFGGLGAGRETDGYGDAGGLGGPGAFGLMSLFDGLLTPEQELAVLMNTFATVNELVEVIQPENELEILMLVLVVYYHEYLAAVEDVIAGGDGTGGGVPGNPGAGPPPTTDPPITGAARRPAG